MNDPNLGDEIKMEMRDLTSAVASRLNGESKEVKASSTEEK